MKNSSYPNSTIIEALCELHFSVGDLTEIEWDGKWFGRFLTQLKEDYDMEPKSIPEVQIQTSIGGQSQVLRQTVDAGHMIYRHRDGSHLIQLTPWKLIINEVKKYRDWTFFSDHIKNAWVALSKVIESMNLNRIGMRYINKIPLDVDDSLGDWIKDTGLFPKDILNQKMDFFYRCELKKTSELKLLLALAEDKSNASPSLIFDIDIIKIKKMKSDWKSLASELNHIHTVIREVFDASCSDKYIKFLRTEA